MAPQAQFPGVPAAQSSALATDDGNWLTLNVWTPDLGAAGAVSRAGGGLPVLVWVHGGAYMFGSASEPGYDGSVFARHGAVVVTCNYRLGVEGFAHIPGVPGNRGLLDVVAALRWVGDNIASFGGNPGNVTVFGESAGAGVIAALLAMPLARGLFRRAIAQSVPGTFFTAGLASDITRAIAARAGLAATAGALAAASPRQLVDAQMAVTAAIGGYRQWGPVALTVTPFSPVVDGEVLPRAPWRALLSGVASDTDLLVGHNRDEYQLFIASGGEAGRITDAEASEALAAFAPGPSGPDAYYHAYPGMPAERLYERVFSDWLFRMPSLHLAQAHAAAGGRTFLYELTYPAPAAPEELGACHALDVPLVWGWRGIEGGPSRAEDAESAGINLMLTGPRPPADFTALGDLMRAEWLAFAGCGEPGWPAYGTQRRLTRIYGRPPGVDPYPEGTSMHLWERHQFDALGLVS
jgi:para-nitrobenzyl esterase